MLRVLKCILFQGNFQSPDADLTGKTVLVTGPTPGGIGHITATTLASFGARVLLAARNVESAQRVADGLPESKVVSCDLIDPASVLACSQAVLKELGSARLDVLVCNAGAEFANYEKTAQGVEATFRVCALGHFALIQKLRPRRTVWVSGDIYCISKGPPDPFLSVAGTDAYHRACLARLLLLREFKDRAQAAGEDSEFVAVHPGVIATKFSNFQGIAKRLQEASFLNVAQGAQSSIYVASCPSDQLHQENAVPYFHNKNGWMSLRETDMAMNKAEAVKLFEACEKLTS